MPFELFLALRYLVARRKQAFLSLISVISTAGVAVGVIVGPVAEQLVASVSRTSVLVRQSRSRT